ncbi:MAG TPA: hypothetical protein VFF76_04505 [Holophagaceae bacterium]|jgi:hypothetical protein|nr:hypothetical protein [Holophagaceae bacterium]
MPLMTIGFLILLLVAVRHFSQARVELLMAETRVRLLNLAEQLEADTFAAINAGQQDPRAFALLSKVRRYSSRTFLEMMHLPNAALVSIHFGSANMPAKPSSSAPQWLQAYDERLTLELGRFMLARHPLALAILLSLMPFKPDMAVKNQDPTEEAARLIGRLQMQGAA